MIHGRRKNCLILKFRCKTTVYEGFKLIVDFSVANLGLSWLSESLVNGFSISVLHFRPEGAEVQESEPADSEEQVKCYLTKLKHFFLGNISDKIFTCKTDTYSSKYVRRRENIVTLLCKLFSGEVAETENADQSQLDQSVVTEIAKQQVIVQYLKARAHLSFVVPQRTHQLNRSKN